MRRKQHQEKENQLRLMEIIRYIIKKEDAMQMQEPRRFLRNTVTYIIYLKGFTTCFQFGGIFRLNSFELIQLGSRKVKNYNEVTPDIDLIVFGTSYVKSYNFVGI